VAGSSVNRSFVGLSADGRKDNDDLKDSPEYAVAEGFSASL
jgi:hypothetical protein